MASAGTSSTPCSSSAIAVPADLDAAEQIRLRARHLEQALRLERRLGAEDVGVGLEADAGAAAVADLAEVLELALGMAALEASCDRAVWLRATSTSRREESALTADTPTPCRPPEVS